MITSGDIGFKNTAVLRNFAERNYSPILLNIIDWIANTYGILITETYRPKKHRNDLHGTLPVRAIDLRSWDYLEGWDAEICAEINNIWSYDDSRKNMKVCIWHNSGFGIHFHIQVHPNTRRIR